MRRPLIRKQSTAVAVGLVLTGAGFWVLYDAYEGRGGKKPRLLGPLLPW
jgi:hypothetical protein